MNNQQKSLLVKATEKIAPSWPLDKLIAVNPLWSLIDKPFDTVATELSAIAGIKAYLPTETYVAWFNQGRIDQASLTKAAQHYGVQALPESLIEMLSQPLPTLTPWKNIADLADQERPANKMSWHDEITHQVSQFCADHYQQISPTLRQMSSNNQIHLYPHWLSVTTEDKGLSIILDEPQLIHQFKTLPKTTDQLFTMVINELALDEASLPYYAHALLLDINGWSSYLAYLQWQDSDQQEEHLMSLLAIKMAWELVIWRYLSKHKNPQANSIKQAWKKQKQTIEQHIAKHKEALLSVKIWALALEYSEQKQLSQQLTSQSLVPPIKAELQAVFCIDVRSEVFRRALEKQSDAIQTLGFAGFFGLPIEYKAKHSQYSRPQLPGLLQPSITVSESETDIEHAQNEQQQARWQRWGHAAPASFSMVESMGWWYAFKMFKQTLFSKRQTNPAARLAPNTQWQITQNGKPLTSQDKAQLAKGILDAMGIKHYAETVLLVGHGSHTSNNLHASGLECGACGGQSGEVNVKVLATLLNDPAVRSSLKTMGIQIPQNSKFVAALHNTTTDQLTCFDHTLAPQHAQWLEQAMYGAQKERAKKLDASLLEVSDKQRHKAFLKRANDWSQVNPEWGLANNNAFIIAPRYKTRQLDLKGRCFLHDYEAQTDNEFAILERLLTAPMLVTHWINMQYNLSVTDHFKFGSGNKVLHNAVGGNIGVFEGNGGDLRIGLPLQSISDGKNWMHTPVRLAVYIAAPKHAIADIVAKHDTVRHLIDNNWLYLFSWQDDTIERYYQQQWLA
ncbi:YbcC family protein [Marinomonas pollencensis]|uniref:Probable inorganic carbon transporter subunit DabA n=1 Tax=Marinomonas pollencensis TaxID=491954 RepID=A0A3E0DNF3_9GAMM|nr:DUF2309 domain-containing protein [Marinomonas pollencensis]REG83331.1 hypothetical protein DFP81_106191 [Marinomonas pollencensis]